MRIKNRAIIFFQPPYTAASPSLEKEIIANCKVSNLSVIKAIYSRGTYDCSSLHKLLSTIRSWQHSPITLIINEEAIKDSMNIVNSAVLGTLYEMGLVRFCSYAEAMHGIKLKALQREECDFLYVATTNFREMINPV